MQLSLDAAALAAFLLALVRSSVWVTVAPPFSSRGVPPRVRLGLAMALAIASVPRISADQLTLSAGPLIAAATLQALAGFILGFIPRLLLSAVTSAGSIIDVVGGFGSSQLFDANSQSASTVYGRFYELLAITLLFVTGGDLVLVRGFVTSFDAAPLSIGQVDHVVIADLTRFFVAAIELALPVVAVLFLADVGLGLLSKAAQQLHVFQLAFVVKIAITLTLSATAIALVPQAVTNLVELAVRSGAALFGGGG